eukprot:COSAG06_NODE_16168_length_1017_cov_1.627451_1_plen_21_part_10
MVIVELAGLLFVLSLSWQIII